MKIALLTDGIHPFILGGMQSHSFYLAKYFAQNKITVDLYHPVINKNKNDFLAAFSDEEKKYIHCIFITFPKSVYFPGHYIYNSYRYSKNIFEKYLQTSSPDFIYAQGFAGWEVIKQKKLKRRSIPPVGVNFHGLNPYQPAFGLRNRLNNLLFKPAIKFNLQHADCIFSLGNKLSSLIHTIVHLKNIIEIPLGIDEEWLINEDEIQNNNVRSFVFIGRYDKVKGIGLLNHSIKNLIGKKKQVLFNFIGPIPDKVQIKHPNVNFYGEIRNSQELKKVLKKSDVLINTSYSEGMPIVIMEAMACGLAIIATDVGVVNELVNNENGILISPGSTKETEKAILQLTEEISAEQLLRMKQQSLKKIKQQFLWPVVINQTIEEINKIIAANKNQN